MVQKKILLPHVLLFLLGLQRFECLQGTIAERDNSSPSIDDEAWSWDRILDKRQTIVANGNVWPPSENESADDCLILITHNQIMWHCPTVDVSDGDDEESQESKSSLKSTVIYRTSGARLRGAFSAPGTDRRRLWLLQSPRDRDLLMELDTVSGEILQVLEVEGTRDGHDVVRVDDRAFMVDTSHGRVIEIEVPVSAHPYTESSIAAGAKRVEHPGFVTIVRRHTGFTKRNHINGVAIHPELLISNLHGGSHPDKIIPDTRLTALSRATPEEDGRELNEDKDGFIPVSNVGTWCHNIAFWEDRSASGIRLISLDSMGGTLVSVFLTGPSRGEREILWAPDQKNPVLMPPEGVARAYDNGARVFTKGLAVQGGVAYFAASYARAPPLRKIVPETLLVAVDLTTKKELWTRTIRSNGLINQVLTESYLGWQVQLPTEISSTELTYHGGGGSLVDHCDNMIPKGSRFCKLYEKDDKQCDEDSVLASDARELCCACDGGDQYLLPLMAGKLDEEIMDLDEEVTATATFVETRQCSDKNNGITKHLALASKSKEKVQAIVNLDHDLDHIVKHICNLNVTPLQEQFLKLGEEAFQFTYAYDDQQETNNTSPTIKQVFDMINAEQKIETIQLILSSRNGNRTNIYHLPQLEGWLPSIEESVLQPLGLSLSHITSMMFTNMAEDSFHTSNSSKNPWAQKSHNVHIPIMTHRYAFFLAAFGEDSTDSEVRKVLRIRSNPGEVYEFNNLIPLSEYNYDVDRRIHLVLDWVEEVEDVNVIKLSSVNKSQNATSSKLRSQHTENGMLSEGKS